MALISKYHTWVDYSDDIAVSSIIAVRLNTNFDTVYDCVNGNLDNENSATDYFFTVNYTTKPTWVAADEGRIIYGKDDDQVYFGNASQWVHLSQTSLWSVATGGINYAGGGNVGIGDTSPDYALDATGTINCTGVYRLSTKHALGIDANNNLEVGDGHRPNDATILGSFNIIIGDDCLDTTTDLSGSYNVFLGKKVADDITSGGYGVYIGNEAGEYVTTGHYNVFIGTNAGGKCVTGGYNVSLGYATGSNQTGSAGTLNIMIGSSVGAGVDDNDANICIGANSMSSGPHDEDSDYNIVLGYSIMTATLANGAKHNIGMGFESLKVMTEGNNNTCLGYRSGYAITTGRQNVCIGGGAGINITTGTHNICIGNISTPVAPGTINFTASIGYGVVAAASNGVYIGGSTQDVILSARSSAPADGDLNTSSVSFWIDEANNEFEIKVRKSNGVVMSGTVALS